MKRVLHKNISVEMTNPHIFKNIKLPGFVFLFAEYKTGFTKSVTTESKLSGDVSVRNGKSRLLKDSGSSHEGAPGECTGKTGGKEA